MNDELVKRAAISINAMFAFGYFGNDLSWDELSITHQSTLKVIAKATIAAVREWDAEQERSTRKKVA